MTEYIIRIPGYKPGDPNPYLTNAELKEEIVRCLDCKWRCTNACQAKHPEDMRDDWFCSGGERRTR